MLGPSQRHQSCAARLGSNVPHSGGLVLWIVAHPNQQGRGTGGVTTLVGRGQRTLRAHGGHGLVGEEQIQPVRLQLVTFILLPLLGGLLFLHSGLLLHFDFLFLMRQSQLLLKSWEDEHHLGVVCCIGCASESIGNGIFTNFIHNRVEHKLVGANQLRHVFHHCHHLFGVAGQGMHPSGNVEAHDAATPSRQQWGRDLKGLGNTMAIDYNLSILVS
mmetsp:Transcript_63667/g.77875  ORF Transcript_63667/g.77875 Transcript_63667/m.77875 type:complete len:216 (-) Transcript_63667:1398-2045(-)